MSLLWGIDELVKALSARPVGAMPQGISGVSIDTRTIQAGEAFFAIKGDRVDGHDYLTAAMRAGAALAVVAEEKLVALGHLRFPLLVVSNVLEALERLGRAARARTKAKVAAVTGSVGKTTVKEMLRLALSACGRTHASLASHNNHWGVPLTLANLPPDARFAVFELGMNHPGEIAKLVDMVRPNVAAITTIAPAHMGAFETVEDIARAKAEIFPGVEAGGTAILNNDDKQAGLLAELAANAGIRKVLTYGRRPGSQFRLKRLRSTGDHAHLVVAHGDRTVPLRLEAPGAHMASNALCALAVAHALGADLAKCAQALSAFVPGQGRGLRHRLRHGKRDFELIDESYNANPVSIEAAIGLLAATPVGDRGRRIAVLGDMLELGRHSERLHRGLAKPLKAKGIDLVFLVGPEMAALAGALPRKQVAGHFDEAGKVVTPLLAALRGGDAVMVKASNGLKFSGLVRALLDACPAAEAAAE